MMASSGFRSDAEIAHDLRKPLFEEDARSTSSSE